MEGATMFYLDRTITEWRKRMAAGGIKNAAVLDELESHVRDDVEQQMRGGATAERAFQEAVQRVGTSAELNQEFAKVSRPQPRLSRTTVLLCCAGFALFVFLVETWLLMESEISAAERSLGVGLVFAISCYIGGLPYLNRMWPGVRGWALRRAIATVCNFAAVAWVCLLLLSTVGVVLVPSGIILSVVCWSLFAAATATVVVIALGTEPNVLNLWTPEAWQSFEAADAAALHFHHDFIGTEHVLLGLLESENSIVPNVLRKMGVSRERVRVEIEKIVGNGPHSQTARPPAYTPRAQKALKLSILEAKALRCAHVDTSHIFLGLVLEGGGVAARVLKSLGISPERARKEIQKKLAEE
jgi:hypothetical protein